MADTVASIAARAAAYGKGLLTDGQTLQTIAQNSTQKTIGARTVSYAKGITADAAALLTSGGSPTPTPAPAPALSVAWPTSIPPIVKGMLHVTLTLTGNPVNSEVWYNGKALVTATIAADKKTAQADIDSTKLPDGVDVALDAWVWDVAAGQPNGKDAKASTTLFIQNAPPVVTPPPVVVPPPVSVVGTADTTDLKKWSPAFDSNGFKNNQGGLNTAIWKNVFYFGDRVLNGNGERQYYMDPAFKGDGSYNGGAALGINPFSFNADGSLRITADNSDPALAAHYWNYPYTSGLITTEDSFSQTYGRFVMNAKLPLGVGLWPAFWQLPKDKSWPPEMDTLEAFGGANAAGEGGATKIHVGMIAGDSSKSGGGWIDVGVDVTKTFNEFATEWTKDTVTHFFNGKQVFQKATPPDFNKPMYLLANLAVGGNWPGLPTAATKFPAYLDIAFIRAYSAK